MLCEVDGDEMDGAVVDIPERSELQRRRTDKTMARNS